MAPINKPTLDDLLQSNAISFIMVYSDGGWFSARVTVAKDHQSNAFTAYLGSLLSREQFEINTMEPKSIDIHKQIPVTEFAVLYKRFGGI